MRVQYVIDNRNNYICRLYLGYGRERDIIVSFSAISLRENVRSLSRVPSDLAVSLDTSVIGWTKSRDMRMWKVSELTQEP